MNEKRLFSIKHITANCSLFREQKSEKKKKKFNFDSWALQCRHFAARQQTASLRSMLNAMLTGSRYCLFARTRALTNRPHSARRHVASPVSLIASR
jgi:hypothetical protein